MRVELDAQRSRAGQWPAESERYGHPDKARARRKIREAHDRAGDVPPLRLVREDGK